MTKPDPFLFYPIWSGSLNMGDTPGVLNDSSFVGLILQFPINITFVPDTKAYIEIYLVTEEVEIFNGNVHHVYFDWVPGDALPAPIGQIDDTDIVPNKPEYHLIKIGTDGLAIGSHTLTILVNTTTPVGLRDDFVLRKIYVDNDAGLRIG